MWRWWAGINHRSYDQAASVSQIAFGKEDAVILREVCSDPERLMALRETGDVGGREEGEGERWGEGRGRKDGKVGRGGGKGGGRMS